MTLRQEPLSPEQLRLLVDAQARTKLVRRAVGVAKFDGATLAIFAILSLVFGGYASLSGCVVIFGMGAIAFIELRAASRLSKFLPGSGKVLAWNQWGLASLLILYALYNLLFPAQLSKDLTESLKSAKDMGYDMEDFIKVAALAVYSSLILVALLVQVPLGFFYLRREKMVSQYRAETPEWILQMQQLGVNI